MTKPSAQDHEHADATAEWEAAYADDVPDTPVDADLIQLASTLTTGMALDLGCGTGQNSIWLAQHGWQVRGVDIAGGAIKRATRAAKEADVQASFDEADLTTWRTDDRHDLVISTYALPPNGPGRTHALTTARDAVAPGGVALIAEFDASLAASGWMAERNLVTLSEVTDFFGGFDLLRAEVHVKDHRHGTESQQLPIVIVIAKHAGLLAQAP